jgi:predicted nucleotidyltransferase
MNKKEILCRMREKITPGQEWVLDNIQYLTIMGSHAYGMNHKDSDFDVYGCTIPPKHYLYPSNFGYIYGYDKIPAFEQFQFSSKDGPPKNHLDVQIYSIVKYVKLCFDNNPNMIDSLFTPDNCVLICTPLFKKIRSNRQLFLHKGAFHKFKGYAFSQMKKIRTNPEDRQSETRKTLIEKYGYDTKFAVHLFRLLDECEQILAGATLNLQRHRQQHKLVREGFYTLEEIEQQFKEKEKELEKLYNSSSLPYDRKLNEKKIRELLVNTLSSFYEDENS